MKTLAGSTGRAIACIVTMVVVGMAFSPALPVNGAPVTRPTKFLIARALPRPIALGRARRIRSLSRSTSISFAVALQPPHPAQEEAFLQSLQDVHSPNFHRYLTPAQWNARFAPSAADEQRVLDWLRSQGLRPVKLYANRLLIDVAGSTSAVERAFQVNMGSYRTHGLLTPFYSSDRGPTLPESLSGIVQNVVLNDFGVGRSFAHHFGHLPKENVSRLHGPNVAAANGNPREMRLLKADSTIGSRHSHARPFLTNGHIDPINLWSSYGYSVGALYAQRHCCNPFHNPTTTTPSDTSIAIVGACGFLDSDLAAFSRQYGMAYHWVTTNIDGGPGANSNCDNSSGNGQFETTLDVEYAAAMSNSFGCYCDTSLIDMYQAPSSGVDSNHNPRMAFSTFFDLWNAVTNADNVRVMSMSWGAGEKNWGTTNESTGHNILNNAAGLGITTTIATGDSGAYDDGTASPIDDNYPSADTAVLAAGGTQLAVNNDGSYNSEIAWNSGGGGCSTYFSAPSYQTTGNFDNGCSGKRSQPDISMNASCSSLQALFFHGSWNTVCGTSEVAPELAGLFAQFNAYALATGSICGPSGTSPCEPLGLATPIIWHQGIVGSYSPHDPFYDITSGNNDAGTGTGNYAAKTGYDLATGWGSINALQLYRLFAWHNTPDYHGPTVTFSGPPLGKWYNYDAKVSWTITEPLQAPDLVPAGISGFSSEWDRIPSDPTSASTPGCCNAFWNGPEYPLLTSGSLGLADLGQQGCHTANVQAWDNLGRPSYPANYGVICYDTITPSITTHSFSPGSPSHAQSVKIAATATDPGCGTTGSCVGHIEYWVNTASDGSNNGAWVHIGSSSGASGSAVWSTGKQFDTGFLKATWDAGRHLIATDPWDNAGNAGECVPPNNINTCATFLLDRPDWPQYRQNAQHTGTNPFEHGLSTGNVASLKRACALSGHGALSGAAVYNGIAYVGSSNGNVYAVDSRCKVKWTFATGGAVRSTPDVTDAVVYVGSSDGKVYALNLQDGTVKWEYATGGAISSSPVVANGVVYARIRRRSPLCTQPIEWHCALELRNAGRRQVLTGPGQRRRHFLWIRRPHAVCR